MGTSITTMDVHSAWIAPIQSAVKEQMSTWPKMQFRYYGVSVSTGRLVADATELQDINTWAASRGVITDGKHPIGNRPVPASVESSYIHEPCYVLEKDVATFFD